MSTITGETTDTKRERTVPTELPILPLREAVLFPQAVAPLTFGQPQHIELLTQLGEGAMIGVIAQRDPTQESPGSAGMYEVGTAALIHKVLRLAPDRIVVFCEGQFRFRTLQYREEAVLRARIEPLVEIQPIVSPQFEALQQNVLNLFQAVIAATPQLPDELQIAAANTPGPSQLADFAGATMPGVSTAERQQILEQRDVLARLEVVHRLLTREVERIKMREKIQSEVQGQFTQVQREAYLREQMRAIQRELGEGEEKDIQELRKRLDAAGMPQEVRTEMDKELGRLEHISPMSPEHAVSRTYLDWMVTLPWNVSTGTQVDIKRAAEILDEDHYGLDKVKQRMLDYLAVLQLRPVLKGPILCFVGAPGVGKTSVGRSIARALGRKFTRLSLGGMHDEAEIRGHRRTYIGALPGQIIQGIRRAGANDPVFMLDEVDKLGHDFRGDPASALLEVLDPEQNFSFRDHYVDAPFDLSKVLFITTANQLDTVPPALRDRMEVIELPGYSDQEKLHIAKRYLIPRQVRENGLEGGAIDFTEDAVYHVIRHYTREAGVRNLERSLGDICRKQARRIAGGQREPMHVDSAAVESLLGAPKFQTENEALDRVKRAGVAVGLAWTPAGGDVLFIESGLMPGGSKGLIMTGQLGSVMQESVQAALTWARVNAAHYGIDPEVFRNSDIHVHVPSGAVPKDGPSAGITIATSMVSAITGRCCRPGVAMTGEITLTGLVLPIGAVKEKVLAAKRSGIQEVILPKENEGHVREELKPEEIEGLRFHYVSGMEQVIELALGR